MAEARKHSKLLPLVCVPVAKGPIGIGSVKSQLVPSLPIALQGLTLLRSLEKRVEH